MTSANDKPNHRRDLILVGLTILAFFIRFVGQPSYPACMHRDEVQWAYNAYSIAETGRDEWGQWMPLHFKYNGEYHVPIVMYLPAIFFKIFTPSDLVFRLPFIILGSLIPILGHFFASLIFKNEKVGLFLAFLLTINPWQIMNSRASGELSILALFFGLTTFIYLFKYLDKSSIKNLILGCISVIAAYFSYIAARLDMPLLMGFWMIIFWKQIARKKLVVPLLLIISIIPFLLVARYPQRFVSTNIISQQIEKVKLDYFEIKTIGKLGINVFYEFIDNYLDYFNPNYIFRNMGEYDRTNLADSGSLYLVEMILVCMGIYHLIRFQRNIRIINFLFGWLFLSPIVGALTYNFPDRPNSSRTVFFYFLISILSAVGLHSVLSIKNQQVKRLFLLVGMLLVGLNVLLVWLPFIKNGNRIMARARGCGYSGLFQQTETLKKAYDHIVIGTLYDYPYVQYLWQTKYDPAKYHRFLAVTPKDNSVVLIGDQDKHDWTLEDYTFTHNSCPLGTEENVVFVGNFNDCKEKYGVRVKKDEINNYVLLLKDGSIDVNQLLIYQDLGMIRREDNVIAFNLYTPLERTKITYTSDEINAMPYIDGGI